MPVILELYCREKIEDYCNLYSGTYDFRFAELSHEHVLTTSYSDALVYMKNLYISSSLCDILFYLRKVVQPQEASQLLPAIRIILSRTRFIPISRLLCELKIPHFTFLSSFFRHQMGRV